MGRDSYDRNGRETSADTSGNWRDMCQDTTKPSGRYGGNDGPTYQGLSRDGGFDRRDNDRYELNFYPVHVCNSQPHIGNGASLRCSITTRIFVS